MRFLISCIGESEGLGCVRQDFEVLQELLREDMLIFPHVGDDGKFWLELTDPENPASLVTLRGLLPDTVAVKSDKFSWVTRCFCSSKGEAKRSDYILFCASESERWIVFMEIKASPLSATRSHIVDQLKGSRCFFEYLRFTGRMFWGIPDFLSGYEERYVAFPNTVRSGRKRGTGFGRSEGVVHDNAEKYLRMEENRGVRLRRLL